MNWHGPLLLSLVDGQANDLDGGSFVGKDLPISNDFANHTVDAFDGVGGVNRLSNVRRIFEHRRGVGPVCLPAL